MRRALELAERGRGLTSPNPMVGAVIVAPGGEIVGEGVHLKAGGPHAEIDEDSGSRGFSPGEPKPSTHRGPHARRGCFGWHPRIPAHLTCPAG